VTAENWTALATVVIAVFTVCLFIATGVQAWLTREAIRLAREEFISSHRPRLIVRDVALERDDRGDVRLVRFRLFNVGETDATVVESVVDIVSDGNSALAAQVNSTNIDYLGKGKIPAGGAREYRCPVSEDITLMLHPIVATLSPNISPVFFGAVLYQDDVGTKRRMAFRRIYDSERARFVPSDDPEHEYSD